MKKNLKLVVLGLSVAVSFFNVSATAQFDIGGFLDKASKAAKIAKGVAQATTEMTEAEEVTVGETMAASFLGATKLHPDTNLQRYVNRVGRWVALHSDRPHLNWSFAVLNMPSVNAFAVPGGTIFVSSGLMQKMKSEAELAGVLGHEIAHVMQRHHVKALRANGWKDAGGEVLSIAAERSKASALGKQAATAVVGALGSIYAKGLDKGDEFEADRIGAMLAIRAGYDPYGLVLVLQKLTGLVPEPGITMMSTHPTAADRMAKIEEFTAVLDRFASHPQVESRFMRATASLK